MKLFVFGVVMLVMSGCTYSTPYGECYGLGSLEKRRETFVYEYDTGNLVLAFIFSETLIIPGIIVLDALKCPVRPIKNEQPSQ